MLIFIFALPIVIADYSSRKIPNIYIIFYAYLLAIIVFFRGFPRFHVLLFSLLVLILFSTCGAGMGDVKLLSLLVLFLRPTSIQGVFGLLFSVLLVCSLEIALTMLITKAYVRSIAMAPAIFVGTGLYLATSCA